MAEFICRLGTPSGEVVTRVVEAIGAGEAKIQLENEGFKVFTVSSADKGIVIARRPQPRGSRPAPAPANAGPEARRSQRSSEGRQATGECPKRRAPRPLPPPRVLWTERSPADPCRNRVPCTLPNQ